MQLIDLALGNCDDFHIAETELLEQVGVSSKSASIGRSLKPAPEPQTNTMQFLCDAMLGGLARWLRAAGYDSHFAGGRRPDRELVELCAREDRVLLTKDRQLALSARDTIPVLLLASRGIDGNARELREVLGVDWQYAPFTRCLVDNALLAAAEPDDAERVPLASRRLAIPLRKCPTCGRLYWPGGHVHRMRRRLMLWQAAA